ncbi:isoleucine--tRNA ligase [Anaerotruncus sp. 80]|uniref:Isoleucine--tRNA ligase n=1 Tax=Anaerotruncus colihominis TaxID=169435 RepID=A0A845QN25_9FIRM|nr:MULTISPECIES: isoleucine--tRNA ligase [Anaerotruncus]NBH62804.1 isoleucine--tRNA ligase [Anaerotruncus colihominis]NCF03458.1 isoleucine--tRNA ligase [Anaerotruncus sp. 80]
MFKKLSDKPVAQVQNEQVEKWKKEDLLHKCVSAREDGEKFVFFEGPPTANGKPGIHHVMARTLKDSICRYKTMQGYQVNRKAGWDTHGLPVEIEVEKQLGMSGKQDIEKYGIKEFNQKCKESVFTYTDMWREMTERMGYLVDLDNPYITLDNNYIESGWWILKEFFKAGLIYEGHKILPYCPRCGTGLASHEVAQGYKEVKVNTLVCKFKRKDAENEYFLAWTTTPWTLASNTVLTVGPDIDYIKAKMTEGDEEGNIFYVAKALANKVLGEGKYEILEEMKGADLEYIEYEQLMPFVKPEGGKKAFFLTCMDYVSVEDGTGIVHTAPAFGEDDYQCGRKYNLPMLQPVDERGCYTETPWAGRFVMEEGLDVDIIKYLAGENKIFSKEKLAHNYPHCWRCGTPLVYYAKPSWYIQMSKLKDQLVANNNTVNWFPEFVGEKRFGNWLADVKDWAISRSRYWGTPIPIWRCECGHLECIGSREELVEKAIEDIDTSIELHRPYVDDVHITCPHCGKPMSRVPEVMDCWFDSGAMPFAQWHYPFENKEIFEEKLFPADFICEGIDQTRGWFYSLMAISTFIMGKAPYRNVLVNDLILDKEGKKMSKSRGNTVSPFELFDKYGADATRWYLLSVSPAWTPTKFDEDGLIDVVSKFFGTLKNVYNFFVLYSNQDDVDAAALTVNYDKRPELDRWILSKYNQLVKDVTEYMDSYDHMKTVRAITDFVAEDLSNWYIRRARRRFYAEEMTEDKKSVYATTYEVLVGTAKLIAPIAPFLSDEIYTNLTGEETVHVAYFPKADESLIDKKVEERMDLVRTLVTLGRGTREKERIKVRQPLSEILVDGKYQAVIEDLTPLIMEELNVKEVVFAEELDQYMNFSLKPNFKVAGPVLGKNIKAFGAALAKENAADVVARLEAGAMTLNLDGEEVEIKKDFVDVRINAKEGFAVAMENNVFTILDTTVTPELAAEGLARELVSKVQQMRKANDYEMMDNIKIFVEADADVKAAVDTFGDYIKKETLATSIEEASGLETYDLNGHKTGIGVERV